MQSSQAIELFYLFFQGMLVFQAVIFGVIYFMTLRKDILFYSLFLVTVASYFFINAPHTFFRIPEEVVWNSQWYDYVNTPAIMTVNLLYLLFLQAFFSDITRNATISKMFRYLVWFIIVLFTVFVVLTVLKTNREFIYYTAKMIAVIPAIIIAWVILKLKPPFAGLVAAGLICNITGVGLTAWMDILYSEGSGDSIFATTYPLFFFRLGILADMILYLIAILKKWNFQEKQLAVEKLQSQLTVEKLRNKISGELHDDIGSTLSGISMYSHLTKTMLQNGNYSTAEGTVSVIQRSANEVINKLGDLVWAIKPDNDSFTAMVDKIQQYGHEMCTAKNIRFESATENVAHLPGLALDVKQHIYLILKEAINNAVKYSDASTVKLALIVENGALQATLSDNGKGFETEKAAGGNGLKNMRQRAESIGARLSICSNENGTCIKTSVSI